MRKIISSIQNLLPKVNHPLSEITFLVEGDRIMVFHGEMVMSEKTGKNYARFDVKTLREQVDRTYSDLYTLPDENEAAAMAS